MAGLTRFDVAEHRGVAISHSWAWMLSLPRRMGMAMAHDIAVWLFDHPVGTLSLAGRDGVRLLSAAAH